MSVLSAASPRTCSRCGAPSSPGARFCHRCGAPVTRAPLDRRTRLAWAGAALVVLVSLILGIGLVREGPQPQAAVPPPPEAGLAATAGPAPDISGLTPRQQFDRLYDRVMAAAERGDSATLLRLTDHALLAYALLDSVDADARYHAAVLQAQVGAYDRALALADTILSAHPGHLLGLLVRGTVAELRGDEAALRRAQEEFVAAWAEAERRPRGEYTDHSKVLDDFHRAANAALRPPT